MKKSGWLDEVPVGEAERIKAEASDYADDTEWAFGVLAGTGFSGDESIENDEESISQASPWRRIFAGVWILIGVLPVLFRACFGN